MRPSICLLLCELHNPRQAREGVLGFTTAHIYYALSPQDPTTRKQKTPTKGPQPFADFLHLTARIERIKAMGAGFVSFPPSGTDGEWSLVSEA